MLLHLQRLPYFFALGAFKKIVCCSFSMTNVQAWARNSYLSNEFRIFRSDLDLTLLFEKKPKPEELRLFQHRYNHLKKIFPALGEINAYVKNDFSWLISTINRYELSRDPELEKILLPLRQKQPPITLPHAEATAYLLRMTMANLRNFKKKPHLSSAKMEKSPAPSGLEHFASIPHFKNFSSNQHDISL